MNKGYILSFSIVVLLIFTSILSIKLNDIKVYYNLTESSQEIYKRLNAEKAIFDEILFRMYVFDFDDFIFEYDDFNFIVNVDEINIVISVESSLNYTISLKYSEDCFCFIEILYL